MNELKKDSLGNDSQKPSFSNIFLNMVLFDAVFSTLFVIFLLQYLKDTTNFDWFIGALFMLVISGIGSILIIKGKLKIVG